MMSTSSLHEGQQIDLQTTKSPTVIRRAASGWEGKSFCRRILEGDLSRVSTVFRVCDIRSENSPESNSTTTKELLPDLTRSIREHEGVHIRATLGDFKEWLDATDILKTSNPFSTIPSRLEGKVSVYADYKHFSELFEDLDMSCKWGGFDSLIRDYPVSSAEDGATLWLSSLGAHTPLHYDSYGCNIVAQLVGRKRWRLWSNANFQVSESRKLIEPTRVPYEESSVYSDYDPMLDDSITPDFDVILDEGDVLFIPKHYWHFVQTLSEMALSVNQWLSVPSDCHDRLGEAIVRFAFGAVAQAMHEAGVAVDSPEHGWLSASEADFGGDAPRCVTRDTISYGPSTSQFKVDHAENLSYMRYAILEARKAERRQKRQFGGNDGHDGHDQREGGCPGAAEKDSVVAGERTADKVGEEAILKRIVSRLLHPDCIQAAIDEALK